MLCSAEFGQKADLRTLYRGADINLAIAFGTVAMLACILFSLIAGALKILVFRRFRMDEKWFQYGARQAWEDCAAALPGRILRRSYAIFSWVSQAALGLGLLLFTIGFFVR